jgi:maltokinase
MTDAAQIADELRDWIQEQRWYASKSRSVAEVEMIERLPLRDDVALALVQTRFATGTHELYQLLVGADTFDALGEPEPAVELVRLMEAGAELDAAEGRFAFHRAGGLPPLLDPRTVRLLGVEQSNSSVVFDERVVLKLFRKLEPGINPELELLRFLTARGFEAIAPLYGWYDYDGQPLAATLGVAQEFLPDALGGWELALDGIGSDPERLLDQLGELGTVTARLHTVLERIFVRLPDDERVAPIAGRGQDVRERLAARAQLGAGGRAIRTHGDYHLGQTLHTPRGWVIIDFEGEPARPLPERRAKRSPLRDIAGMLRSFAYVASAAQIQRHTPAPAEFEECARERFLRHYLAAVDATLLPAGEAAVANLLSIYELEKAIYELQYELDNRPDWVPIPVAGIRRLLESE